MHELDPVFTTVADYFSILSEPTRLKIMHSVCRGEKTVSDIVAETGATQTNVSRHLAMMHRHGVLTRRKSGTLVYYRVADETMLELCRSVCTRIAGAIDERKPLKQQLMKLMPRKRRPAHA